jgi:hypothetical protein
VPVLVREGQPDGLPAVQAGNPWDISFMTMFRMSNDSHLFRTHEQLEKEGFRLVGNVSVKGDPHSPSAARYLPLYEAKLMHQFDHRFAETEVLNRLARSPGFSPPARSAGFSLSGDAAVATAVMRWMVRRLTSAATGPAAWSPAAVFFLPAER